MTAQLNNQPSHIKKTIEHYAKCLIIDNSKTQLSDIQLQALQMQINDLYVKHKTTHNIIDAYLKYCF